MKVTRTRIGVAMAALLITAGCGGSDADDADPVDDVESTAADRDDLPDDVPSDFYLPDGMTVSGVSRSGDAISFTGTFETGEIGSIQSDMVAGLEAAGYELLSNDDIAVFVKNGVGRVRVRTSEFLGDLTVSVDIDTWTDEQLDELRDITAEEINVPGRATAIVDGVTYEAAGACLLRGSNRSFFADDVSITLQIDESRDPTFVYADVTTPDGAIYSTEPDARFDHGSSPQELSARGEMTEFTDEDAGSVDFSITATCES